MKTSTSLQTRSADTKVDLEYMGDITNSKEKLKGTGGEAERAGHGDGGKHTISVGATPRDCLYALPRTCTQLIAKKDIFYTIEGDGGRAEGQLTPIRSQSRQNDVEPTERWSAVVLRFNRILETAKR